MRGEEMRGEERGEERKEDRRDGRLGADGETVERNRG
jgi:hypothetical protein